MTASVVARLRRLIKLTEHIYEQRAREIAETSSALSVVEESLAVSRCRLDEESLVNSLFPNLLTNRVVKLGKESNSINAELQQLIEAAAMTRANVKGLEGKLEREIASDVREQTSRALEEVIDRFLRSNMTSLR